jgi:methylated-DNA-protein-cysteine methyltransferase related protein
MARKLAMSAFDAVMPSHKLKRRMLREGASANEQRDAAFRRAIFAIPAGKVSTYGKVAAVAGYPMLQRSVARLLRTDPPESLPWHRIVGARGAIKTPDAAAREQRARLKMEGVTFRGKLVDMDAHEHVFRVWEHGE